MKVTHLYHSGVLVELEHHILLFDHTQGNLELNSKKPLYIFVSHQHYDHYDQNIFQINHPAKTYILSADIKTTHHAFFVSPHQEYMIDDLKIYTLLSTDLGCAFIIEVENQTIYHAGDLNWWHWEGEPKKDNEYQRITYQTEIKRINKPIHFAFVVVDKRQENDYLLGLQFFLGHVHCQYIMPIHYFGDYSISKSLQQAILNNPYHAQILYPTHQNETFVIT